MGNILTHSSQQRSGDSNLNQEQKDIRYLADRMAFGDKELLRVYRCYNILHRLETPHRLSFFTDWAIHASKLAEEEALQNHISNNSMKNDHNAEKKQQPYQNSKIQANNNKDDDDDYGEVEEEIRVIWHEQKKSLMQVMEQEILPANFGNNLYRNCFLSPRDQTVLQHYQQHHNSYDSGGTDNDVEESAETSQKQQQQQQQQASAGTDDVAASANVVVVDEYTRVARLEKFFDAASNCTGRRGNRVALNELVTHISKFHPIDAINHKDLHTDGEKSVDKNNHHDTLSNHTITSHPVVNNINDNRLLLSAFSMVQSVYRMALACSFLNAANRDEDVTQFLPTEGETIADHPALEALSHSIIDFARKKRIRNNPYGGLPPEEESMLHAGLVTKDDVLGWSEATAPLFSVVLPTLLHLIMFPDVPYPPSRTSFELPRIEEESCFFDRNTSPLLFSFGCLSSSLRGTFVRLYTSLSDGLSFNRLLNALLGYGGPTLLLIRETQGGVFGAFTASSWKEGKDFYGNSDCFLYQLLPTTAIYRPSGNATNYMYCNSEARSRGYDGLAHGIGFGGTSDQPRLFLNEEFDACVASSQDLTFESGPLLPRPPDGEGLRKQFDIESLEVWGVGGEQVVNEALGARNRVRQIRDAAIRKSRKVDRASFLDDFRSGLIESKAFKYRQEMDGRADVDVEERQKKNQG